MLKDLARQQRAGEWPAGGISVRVADRGRKRLGGPDEANVKAIRTAELVPLGRVGANARATPRDVAVMSNTVHSIGRRKKPLIRQQEPRLVAAGLNAMRLVLALLFRVRAKSDYGFEEFKFSVPELGRIIGLHYRMTREQTENLLRDMISVDFSCRTDEVCFVTAPVMAISKLDETGTSFRLHINEKLEPYLLNLREYRQLHRSVLALKSVRAMLLYILARKYIGLRWKPRPRIPLADLLSVMQVDKRTPWALFRRDHLEPAIDEITRKTELKIRYSAERGGRVDRKRGEVEAGVFGAAERKGAGWGNKEIGEGRLIPPPARTPVVA